MSVVSFSNRLKTKQNKQNVRKLYPIAYLYSSQDHGLSVCLLFTPVYWVPTEPLSTSSITWPQPLNLLSCCFASTNQPEGNSFRNRKAPNKFSIVPSKK